MQTKCRPCAHQLGIDVVSAHLPLLTSNSSAPHKCNPHLTLRLNACAFAHTLLTL